MALSLVIPFRDEAKNLNRLISSLKEQSYNNWELILVNDHSTDDGVKIVKDCINQFRVPVTMLNSSDYGKKKALLYGVHQANNEWIITSDADCTFHPEWLQTMASYQKSTHADLIIGPVRIEEKRGALSWFQRIDFTALQLSGAAAALNGKPIMCNGANLLFNKSLYLQTTLNPHIASGDDMFLLEWMKQNGKYVRFIKAKKAVIQTAPVGCIKDFLMQRARWAAKASAYRDKEILISGLLVSGLSFMLLSTLIIGIWQIQLLYVFGISIGVKSFVDYALLRLGKTFFNYKLSFASVVLLQVLYPIYVLSVLMFPLFFKIKWKARNI